MGQITTQWTRDGYLNTDYNLRSQVDDNGVLTANAPNYKQTDIQKTDNKCNISL